MGFIRRSTTAIIGEIIGLTSEVEDCISLLGRLGYELFKMSRINDDTTMEVCRKVEMAVRGALRSQKKMHNELEDTLDATRSKSMKVAGWFLGKYVISKDVKILKDMLRESCDELGERMIYLHVKDPACLTPKMVRMVNIVARMRRELDNDWAELNARTKAGSGFNVFAIFNSFVINFFKFTNRTVFKHIVNRVIFLSHVATARIHKQVVSELDLPAAAIEAEGRRMTQEALKQEEPKQGFVGVGGRSAAGATTQAGAGGPAGGGGKKEEKKSTIGEIDVQWKPIVKGRKK